jgi:aerobic carbon-monoxide dehydrogenase small subunit
VPPVDGSGPLVTAVEAAQDVVVVLTVNGREITRSAPVHLTLLRWLRDAGVFDVRYGCGEGVCGACTVLVDGEAVTGCLVLAAQVNGARVQTAAGLAGEDGSMNDLQRAFLEHGAVQCGFCTSGMLVVATELLERGEELDREAVVAALEGNLCRCTGYQNAIDAVRSVAAGRSEGPA